MKKIILELLIKHFDSVLNDWIEKLQTQFGNKFSNSQIKIFVKTSLETLSEVIETSNFSLADQYLIDAYNLFTNANINLLEISQIFGQGRYAILHYIEKDTSYQFDPVIVVGFLDEMIEQVFARYSMLHQNAKMRELEHDRDRLASKLEINQQYLKNILHTSDSAIMVVDENEIFIAWNKGAEKIFGFSEDEVVGRSSCLLIPDTKKHVNELKYIQKEIITNGFVKIPETERRTKEGKIIPVQLSVTHLSGNNNKYSGRTVVIKDFSEVKKLQQQVDQSEKLAVLGQLAAGVAHEIGNPLTSISSLVQILQRKSQDEFFAEQLSHIKENIDRITKIVRELVDFSRPPSYEEANTQIADVIKAALGIVKYDKRVKKVEFEPNLAQDLPNLNIVPDQLLQVFVNILINALDAISGNGIIKVNSYQDNKFVYVEIIDNGCGMEEDVIDKIFDPFFTTKDVGKGTGLGLSVSYGIIKNFKGVISVKSQLNEGSTFTIKLPIEEK